jgi:hypothetical protein
MDSPVVRPRPTLYRIALYGSAWHVVRPQGSLAHAFTNLDQAFAFVRNDCGDVEVSVELLVDNFYMLKQITPTR